MDKLRAVDPLTYLSILNLASSTAPYSLQMEQLVTKGLEQLAQTLEQGVDALPANLKTIYERAKSGASDVADKMMEFAKENPVYASLFCQVVALGALCLITPRVLVWLGFSRLGPVKGSWASRFQASYGDVAAKSLFAYLQSHGMTMATKAKL